MATGTVRYWAAAKAAAGMDEEPFDAPTLGDLLARMSANPDLAQVLRRCSFLVNGAPAGTRDPHAIDLPEGAVVEVLPPFAGG
ncbi:MoaD/ThiS family protein [Microtetraspora sp. NBRC 16547]|uniref:MoaD/ThiS family protein n=1 Tax=Microtetraspora sp. NBRC 16547 TaxID=3030993 RepID=UPI0024A031AE|nr:MoaD/ThiS family protein [Microtetraspora sp. NBRC 16547]GLW96446.1 thiamine biosynthesis protein ThiS [Microtetraspora sp. NBRC 16547]